LGSNVTFAKIIITPYSQRFHPNSPPKTSQNLFLAKCHIRTTALRSVSLRSPLTWGINGTCTYWQSAT